MSDILEKIINHKKQEVKNRMAIYPVALLEQSIYFQSPCVSLKRYLEREDKHGIIAEIKRKSPSKGFIQPHINVEELSIGYMQAGASALSVLTDEQFFGGSKQDLMTARKFNYCPILRKDFIIDEYQLFESRSWGADAVLLIAAALSPEKCEQLAVRARELGMEVLLEVHNEEEAQNYLGDHITIVGVNNRDLKSFETKLDTSVTLSDKLPADILKISESGINSAGDIVRLRKYGYKGFLIGENFMKHSQPQEAARQLIQELDKLNEKSYAQA